MRLLLLFWIATESIRHLATAADVCMTCRPAELQNGAGIGIDLTMAYGTAAVKFANGTILDVIKIDGSPQYISAMRILAEDARNMQAGLPSSLPKYVYYPPEEPILPLVLYPHFTPMHLYRFLKQRAWQIIMPMLQQPRTPHPDPWINAVAGMLSDLKSAIRTIQPSVTHNKVILSYPDFVVKARHIYESRFQVACQEAGLEEFLGKSQHASHHALNYYGIRSCDLRESYEARRYTYCDSENSAKIDGALIISYKGASFGITVFRRWFDTRAPGDLFPAILNEHVNHGAGSKLLKESPTRYWAEIRKFIEEAIQDDFIDRLMVIGSHSYDHDLMRILHEIFNARKFSGAWQTYLIYLDKAAGGEDVASEDLFVAARGAAEVARLGMKTGFDDCLVPDICKKGKEPTQHLLH